MALSRYRAFLGVALSGFLVSAAEAAVFCVDNRADVVVHAETLDQSRFTADVAVGARACCDGPQCVDAKKGRTSVLVVTGYVPLNDGGVPNWQAECRAKVGPGHSVVVTGTIEAIACRVEKP